MFKSSILACNRMQAGAVELESAELRFNTDAAGQPTTVTVKQVRLAHMLSAAVGGWLPGAHCRFTGLKRVLMLKQHTMHTAGQNRPTPHTLPRFVCWPAGDCHDEDCGRNDDPG